MATLARQGAALVRRGTALGAAPACCCENPITHDPRSCGACDESLAPGALQFTLPTITAEPGDNPNCEPQFCPSLSGHHVLEPDGLWATACTYGASWQVPNPGCSECLTPATLEWFTVFHGAGLFAAPDAGSPSGWSLFLDYSATINCLPYVGAPAYFSFGTWRGVVTQLPPNPAYPADSMASPFLRVNCRDPGLWPVRTTKMFLGTSCAPRPTYIDFYQA